MKRAGLAALAAVVVGLAAGVSSLTIGAAQSGAAGAAQPPARPTFSTTVEYVEVDARVVDGKGNPVRNLEKEDFHLFEDGKEQAIESFAAIDIAAESTSSASSRTSTTGAAAARVEPDVSANQFRAEESRVYVIVLDDRQIDAARTFNTIRIARTFIERSLGAHDLAAIVATSGRTDISQTLTGNKTLLLKAVDGFMGRKLESEAIETFNGTHPQTSAEWFFEATAALRAVREVVAWMAGMRGRSKVVLLVSEGTSANYEGLDGEATMLLEEERQTIAAATRGNVSINAIDPRGLYAYEELTALGSSPAAGRAAATAIASARAGGAPAGPSETRGADAFVGGAEQTALNRSFRAEVDRAQMSLRLIADETGGVAGVNTNNFQAVLDRLVVDHSTYYLLGYYPKNPRRDGKNRTIDVKVKGMKVVARRGYREANGNAAPPPALPGPPGTSPALRDAINSPLPLDGLALTATAAAFRGQDGKASVAVIVEAPGGSIDVTERDGTFIGAVEMTTVAVDGRNGVAAAETTRIGLQLTRETAERLRTRGFRAFSKLDNVGPGRYQVRVAVAPDGSSRRGSVWYDIDVPDFSKGDLVVSGLVIASTRNAGIPTGDPGKLFAGALPIPPTAVRRFTAGDELIALAEVYANRRPAGDATLTVFVRDDRGGMVVRRSATISMEDFAAGDGAHRSVTNLPLADLAPGSYVLSLEATLNGDGARIASRSVPFQVVP